MKDPRCGGWLSLRLRECEITDNLPVPQYPPADLANLVRKCLIAPLDNLEIKS
jgi:hypothetical protein